MYLQTINLSPLKIENCFYATEDFFNCRKIMDKFPAFTGYDLVIYFKLQIVIREAVELGEVEINDLADYIKEPVEKLSGFFNRTELNLKTDVLFGAGEINPKTPNPTKKEELQKTLTEKGVINGYITQIFKKFDEKYIAEKIKITNNSNPDNWPGFFRRAVEQNYQEAKPESISPYRNNGYDEDLYQKMLRGEF